MLNPFHAAPTVPSVGSGSSRGSGTETSVAGATRDFRGRKSPIDLLAIGASTGGPNALAELFTRIPAPFPIPIVIVQHMPPMFTQLLAERLTRESRIPTEEAKSGTILEPGHAYVAPGDFHLTIVRSGTRNRLQIDQSPAENGCRPSFDPLLRSVATLYGPNSMAVVLTGMGQDGLRGCEAMRAVAGQILVQDEASSVVWGMPGHVARAGLADQILPLHHLADEIVRRVRLGRG
jgi:two-component system chemotaxis response regulator CheB